MTTRKLCPACGKHMVNVKRSRPVTAGRARLMVCLDCGHKWTSLEMTSDFIRDKVLRSDHEALRALDRFVG